MTAPATQSVTPAHILSCTSVQNHLAAKMDAARNEPAKLEAARNDPRILLDDMTLLQYCVEASTSMHDTVTILRGGKYIDA